MKIDSYYPTIFHSDNLTESKYVEFLTLATNLRNIRNEISILVNANLLKYVEMTKIDFLNEMLPVIKARVQSNFTKQLCIDVYQNYQNRFSSIKSKMKFSGPTTIKFNLYKKNTKTKKKGEYKSYDRISKSTKLSKVLTFLAKYGSDSILQYIKSQITACEIESKIEFYQSILDICDKFGFERLMNLAKSKRENILKKYSSPIEYASLAFRGRSRIKKNIVSLNTNKNSEIKAFVEISWLDRNETIIVPVKHSYAWHGRNLPEYTNGTDTSYTVGFNEKNKQLKFLLLKKGQREYLDVIDIAEDNTIGFDVNTKHSQIIGSDLNIHVDHNRESLDKLVTELKQIDTLKSKNKDYKVGKRRQSRIDTLRRSVVEHTKMNCSKICKQMLESGYIHAVFENLNNSFGKSFVKTEDDINFNRLVREMKISSIKNEFEHIARNGRHDKLGTKISVSYVHAEYTSQECSVCHYIDEGNRTSQESFKCLECGHEENADSNASRAIKKRLTRAVRSELLSAEKELGGAFRPKTFKRESVKSILLAFREAHPSNANRGEVTTLYDE